MRLYSSSDHRIIFPARENQEVGNRKLTFPYKRLLEKGEEERDGKGGSREFFSYRREINPGGED